ncbi:unnamed protein product [Gongylonema pulchrum]|uniref:glucuronosyltransferase n=1 Tax=Gongylonema pulchrum TaxID=637853 RepID=A0A183DXS8_9BILA|nr:unnamed protein product [Gongylonema pulchrum]
MEYHFIMKVDKADGKLGKMVQHHSNVDLVQWLPQFGFTSAGHERLKCFIMHGGFYGMLEAAVHAVPLVVIPFFADQFRNAKAAEHLGIAISLQKYEMNYQHLKYALEEVLNKPSFSKKILCFLRYSAAARRLSRMIRMKPNKPEEQLVKWTEFVIEFGALPELRVHGDRFNTIKYFGIDIIAFLLVCVFGNIFLLYVLGKWLLRCNTRHPLYSSKKLQ